MHVNTALLATLLSFTALQAGLKEKFYQQEQGKYELLAPQCALATAILAKGEMSEKEVRELFAEAGYVQSSWRSWLPGAEQDIVTDELITRITCVLNALHRSTQRADGSARHLQMPICVTAINTLQLLFPRVDFAKLYGFINPLAWTDAAGGKG